MSKVLPILFNTDMVRAILDGRKTVTRRAVKGDIDAILHSPYHAEHPEVADNRLIEMLCNMPYQPGDILYVRETWARLNCCSCEGDNHGECFIEPDKNEGCYAYRATHDIYGDVKWNPSVHMPKEAARIWLKVTDVRVERLQDITNEDIQKEGIEKRKIDSYIQQMPYETDEYIRLAHTIAFQDVWNSTIKKSDLDTYGWDANPWVWVLEFERCEKPENSEKKNI